MEHLTRAIHIATTDSVDTEELAAIAAHTFPLACPPSTAAENIASFIDANLSATRFAEYLGDPQRAILTAQQDGRIVGYAMLIRGVDDDTDVQRAVEIRPAAELSKMYLLPDYHGTGVATALMERALATAAGWSARCVWLGVNQRNQRAQRFYLKNGFKINGTRTFQVGARRENDYIMVRELR
jgi:GNAT superfamily N-acetyltransferase